MGGLLVPSWYRVEEPSSLSFALVSFIFGFSTACAAFTAVSIIHQAHRTWRRSRKLATHPYIVMVAVEWVSSVMISVISILFIHNVIPPSFWLFFGLVCLWVLQIQCIMHIIINRIALILCDTRRVRKLKWAMTLLIGAVNISVFIIWMPARLQISARWIWLNDIWDRIEKGIVLLIDLGLNLYFIYIVRAELINHGLKKYWNLYWFNVGMIFISIALDILLIGIMSVPRESTFIYVQFHPLMYLIKLKIEMNMADLIIKIVKASSPASGHQLNHYITSTGPPQPASRPGLHTDSRRYTSDTTTRTKKSTLANSQINILHEEQQQQQQQQQQPPPPPPTTKHHSKQQDSGDDEDQGWALTRLPSHFDAGDVVDPRKASVAEGSCEGKTEPWAAPVRPPLMRNMSELTELEVGAGYLDRDVRDKRTSGTVEQCSV